MTRLYTPVLLFTVLALARLWIIVRPRISWVFPTRLPSPRVSSSRGRRVPCCCRPCSPRSWVRRANHSGAGRRFCGRAALPGSTSFRAVRAQSAPPLVRPPVCRGCAQMPGGFVENIASIPWTLIAVLVAAAACAAAALPRYWLAFTLFAGCLALGPFIRIGGVMTYVPTPWTLLRYVPVIGAARMPQRMVALVMLGLAILLAFALRELRSRLRESPRSHGCRGALHGARCRCPGLRNAAGAARPLLRRRCPRSTA